MSRITIALIFVLLIGNEAHAAEDTTCPTRTELPPTVNFRLDNDLFGGQDQGYSNGAQLSLVSPNLEDYTNDPCLPATARRLNQFLGWLAPSKAEQKNMMVTFAQGIFTPKERSQRDLIKNDRPYTGILLVGFGYNARNGYELATTQLKLGIVGSAALGEQAQNTVHKIIGAEKFDGWDNQLRNEPLILLQRERMWRTQGNSDGPWEWDAIGHYGGAIGNLATFANTGYELRWGHRLPNDFGSTPLRPAGENTAPREDQTTTPSWRYHLFLTTDLRWVLRDITFDGNTWKDSHSVDKKPVVAHVGYGLAVMKGRWKFAFSRYHQTREFKGQEESPVFGSFTISYLL